MQADVVAFLCDGRALGSNEPPTRRDTHGAILFLVGDRAWKLKRAVRFGYLDFSIPEKRREALEAELRLNRRTAPTLYRAVHPINRDGDGRLSIDGDGAVVDWLLEMARFPDEGLLGDLAEQGALDSDLLTRLADRIAGFHDDIAPTIVTDGAQRFRSVIEGNVASMAAVAEILDAEQATLVSQRQLRFAETLAQRLDARGRSGRVRHGHGDLHLANIVLIDGEPTLFDCLEFSEELATTDLLYDLAFLLMDLWHRGRCVEANIVFNRYMDVSAEDDAGLALLPLFLSTRATVRAYVAATRSLQAGRDIAQAAEARAYLDLALALLQPAPPRLVAIGGLSGTGKSTVARLVGRHLGRAPGARSCAATSFASVWRACHSMRDCRAKPIPMPAASRSMSGPSRSRRRRLLVDTARSSMPCSPRRHGVPISSPWRGGRGLRSTACGSKRPSRRGSPASRRGRRMRPMPMRMSPGTGRYPDRRSRRLAPLVRSRHAGRDQRDHPKDTATVSVSSIRRSQPSHRDGP